MCSFRIHRRPVCLAVWLAFLLLMPNQGHTEPATYNSKFNKTCKYTALNITRNLFLKGIEGAYAYITPLETSLVVRQYQEPWRSCFAPNETVDIKLLQSGQKLPCFYKENEWGNFDYWEENACDILLRSNCYCYSVNKYVGSYCEPGLGGTGKPFALPVVNCSAPVQGVIQDGGRLVDRWSVYNKPTSGHYIALAVKPSTGATDTGDFHFWRLDDDNAWSYKAGDTLSRNTFRNGTLILDIEAPEARGAYTSFCGFFEVFPDTHKLVGNGYYFSNLPARFKLWREVAVKGSVVTLDTLSPGWLTAYRSYYADAGWEDALPSRKERAQLPIMDRTGHPHTYSARPFAKAAEKRAARKGT